jgi:ribosomal protein S18 acetylase RimI-like enzyme
MNRPPTESDAPRLAAFMQSTAAVDGIGGATEDEIRQWFEIPGFDAEHDARVSFSDGEIVAYADLTAEEGERGHVYLDTRGDVELLMDWAEERARVLVPSPKLRTQVWSENATRRELLEGRAYRPIRHSFEMQIDLDRPPEPPLWPEDASVRTLDVGSDDRALYDLHTETFADAWGFEQASYERWRHFHVDRPDFDPELCFLSEQDGEPTGFSICRTNYADHEGWINLLGVQREWRRRGLGLALLRHSFVELWNRGAREVGLGVDAASLTGATRLYERAGMRVVKHFTAYEKEL